MYFGYLHLLSYSAIVTYLDWVTHKKAVGIIIQRGGFYLVPDEGKLVLQREEG